MGAQAASNSDGVDAEDRRTEGERNDAERGTETERNYSHSPNRATSSEETKITKGSRRCGE